MFDLGFFELMVIGVVALIVVGPKDLPKMFRTVGKLTGQAKAMAREFTSAMNQAADESGMRDIQKDLKAMANPRKAGLDAIKDAAGDLENWDPMAETEAALAEAEAKDKDKAKAKAADAKPAEGPETAALRTKRDAEAAQAKAKAAAKAEARTAPPAEVQPSADPVDAAAPPESTP